MLQLDTLQKVLYVPRGNQMKISISVMISSIVKASIISFSQKNSNHSKCNLPDVI